MPADLNELARRAVGGDAQALSSLCEALTSPVSRLCTRMLGAGAEADDAAQDILVKVVTNLSSFEGRSALTTWVHRLAVRHLIALKAPKREAAAVDEVAFSALLDQGLAYGATQPAPSPETRALINEVRLSCTQGMLMMLSVEDRLALVLVELLGFDSVEGADIAEVSAEAFRQRLARARARLGAFLRAQCGVVCAEARCRCERQLPAKRALGLSAHTQRYVPLSSGDLGEVREVEAARDELRAIRQAFHQGGTFEAPTSLRQRLVELMPTVLAARS